MREEEEKDMIREEDIKSIHKSIIPNSRKKHILKALNEVDLIQKGILPKKTAREFLKELRDEQSER